MACIDHIIIVQSRMGSSRLPRKMVETIGEDTLFEVVIKRLLSLFPAKNIYLATSCKSEDHQLVVLADGLGINVFTGSEDNVFSRFRAIAISERPAYVVRITGDSPLVDPRLIKLGLSQIFESKLSYISTTLDASYPVGIHVEIFDAKLLIDADPDCVSSSTKEHVTPFIYNDEKLRKGTIFSDIRYPEGRFTVDYQADLNFMRSLVQVSGLELREITVSMLQSLKENNPTIFDLNKGIAKSRTVAD